MSDRQEIDVRDLSIMLADDIEGVVDALRIDVKTRTRRKLICYSPWNSHHNPKLEIELFPMRGKWNDWIEGRYGDALGLVACALSGSADPQNQAALRDAINWAKERFGVAAPTYDREAWARRMAAAAVAAKKREAAAARELAEKRATAKGLWLAGAPLKPGDVGWEYLLARGIDLQRLPRMPGAIRLSLTAQWHGNDGQVEHVGPALLTAMMRPDGNFGSLHRTWIDPFHPGEKAALDPPRKMWPNSSGCAIRLWRGESGLSETEAAKAGMIEDIIICEGIEDGLSLALMAPEFRVVACGSLPGLSAYVPPKFVRRITVAADNDWDKPAAKALLNRACARLANEFGKQVSISRSPVGKDFNDLLRGV
jgi:hypothetical protein